MNEEALKAQLKSIAQERKLTFNQIWKQLLLERFLAHFSSNHHTDNTSYNNDKESLKLKSDFFIHFLLIEHILKSVFITSVRHKMLNSSLLRI